MKYSLYYKILKGGKNISQPMKQAISATIDKELVSWIDAQVKTGKYRNRSHLVELALKEYKEKKA